MHNKLPTDIYAIKKIGIDNYQNKFFWPVSDEQFFSMEEFIIQSFYGLYETLDPVERDIILGDTAFIAFIIYYLHSLKVADICKKQKRDILHGPLSLQDYNPDWSTVSNAFKFELEHGTFAYRLRRILKNIKFNAHLSVYSQIKGIHHPEALGLGSATQLRQEYLKKKNVYLDNHYWTTIFKKVNFKKQNNLSVEMEKRIKDFINLVAEHCFEQFAMTIEIKHLITCWIERLKSLKTYYQCILDSKPSLSKFLFTETARPLNKIAAHAFKRNGTFTTAFHHGNSMGGLKKKSIHFNGPLGCDEFVCPTMMCADSFRKLYEQENLVRFNSVDFTSTDSQLYANIFQEAVQNSFPEKVETVMVMGFPMTSYRYMDIPGLFFYFQLDLELRLVRLLKNNGFKVIYKIHPETRNGVEQLFEEAECRIVSEPFEQVWHMADTIIVKYSASTTFGYALCTNRPIVFIDLEKEYWFSDHYSLLSKRCKMIPAWLNEANRIEFDEEKLLHRLAEKPELPDHGYVKKFMYPSEI